MSAGRSASVSTSRVLQASRQALALGFDIALNATVPPIAVGEHKPGQVRFGLTDLTVPVTGLPLTLGRAYDSLERDRVGDFGYGWTLALGNPRLEVAPNGDVTLTQPNGRRVTFRFTPRSVGGALGFLLQPAYTPEAGVYGTLTANGCELLVVSAGRRVCFLDNPDYAPTLYTYTDPYGRVFKIGADGKLRSIRDLQGNTLTFAADGITSSNGNLRVAFERDGQGRITTITDPAGNAYRYVYSPEGDLTEVHQPGIITPTTYLYDVYGPTPHPHLFHAAADPLGRPVIYNKFYEDGASTSRPTASSPSPRTSWWGA